MWAWVRIGRQGFVHAHRAQNPRVSPSRVFFSLFVGLFVVWDGLLWNERNFPTFCKFLYAVESAGARGKCENAAKLRVHLHWQYILRQYPAL